MSLTAIRRGCGTRQRGGVYLESAMSERGEPVEFFLMDPPVVVSEHLDLVNKATLMRDSAGIPHVLIWVGAEHYPYVPDFVEEVRRFGASRRVAPSLELESLIPGRSRMIFAHARAYVTSWEDISQPQECPKELLGHSITSPARPEGPCIGKLWELLPTPKEGSAAGEWGVRPAHLPGHFLRQVGSTVYDYRPTGEVPIYRAAFFLWLPIARAALVRREDGSVNEWARERLEKGALPYEEVDE